MGSMLTCIDYLTYVLFIFLFLFRFLFLVFTIVQLAFFNMSFLFFSALYSLLLLASSLPLPFSLPLQTLQRKFKTAQGDTHDAHRFLREALNTHDVSIYIYISSYRYRGVETQRYCCLRGSKDVIRVELFTLIIWLFGSISLFCLLFLYVFFKFIWVISYMPIL